MEKIKNINLLLLSVLSGILLWLAWTPHKLTFLIFIALVPILIIEYLISNDEKKNKSSRLFYLVSISMLIWNILSTYWIYKASLEGAIAAIIFNTLLMVMPFLLFHKLKNITKRESSALIIIFFWIGFEYLHLNWDLAWPWLTLGNVFSTHPDWVQWYEFTGVLGGTLWIWLVNIFVFSVIKSLINHSIPSLRKSESLIKVAGLVLLIAIPLVISWVIKKQLGSETGKNVIIVQPNIDPYHEKFASMSFSDQLNRLIDLTKSEIDSNTILVVWPETALSMAFDEKIINENQYIQKIKQVLSGYPNVKLITGMDSYHFFENNEEKSATARYYKYGDSYYDAYNSAILIDKTDHFEIYHKSRLVPGVEKMPYPKLFRFLEKLTINLGGTSGSLGKQKEPSVFKINSEIVAAPVICYESVFGEYVSRYINKGANVIVVITNDGWWGNSSGYEQHVQYARLRAIELRKDIVRSANTGISAYINSRGEVLEKTSFWVPDVLKHQLNYNNKITFYAKTGDYLGRIASFISVVLILLIISRSLMKKKKL